MASKPLRTLPSALLSEARRGNESEEGEQGHPCRLLPIPAASDVSRSRSSCTSEPSLLSFTPAFPSFPSRPYLLVRIHALLQCSYLQGWGHSGPLRYLARGDALSHLTSFGILHRCLMRLSTTQQAGAVFLPTTNPVPAPWA